MSIATPLWKIPPAILRDLLYTYRPVAPACPFGFLFSLSPTEQSHPNEKAQDTTPWHVHIPWLRQHHILLPDRDVLTPAWQQTLQIVSRPRSRIAITDTASEKAHRVMFVSDGQTLVFAMFDRQDCLLSEPFSYPTLVDRLMRAIGVPDVSEDVAQALWTSPQVLKILGALAQEGLDVQPRTKPRTPSVPLSEQRAVDILARLLGDREMASALLVDMLADRLLLSERQQLWVHPQFERWHRVISSGRVWEVIHQPLPNGQLPSSIESPPEKQRGVFLGPTAERCLMWPSPSMPDDILLARLERKSLREILLFLLGAPESEELSLQEKLTLSNQKFSFRG